MLSLGVDYYPEHWERDMWEADADLMKQSGVKIVRLAEFAWCRLEPKEGVFDFKWLDEAIEIFSKRDIDVIIGTPTNCPPLWVFENYPDSMRYKIDGVKDMQGVRGHRCYSSPAMIKFTERIVRKLAERYANNPAVVAWQIDNELEAHQCCCENCSKKFIEYIKEKYGTLEEVNSIYGNVMWSGEYSDWNQVRPPAGKDPLWYHNPALVRDWIEFCRDNANNYAWLQADIIREINPDAVITTNVWLSESVCNLHQLYSKLDFVSFDNYPTTVMPKDKKELYSHAFHLDLMRGVKNQNFWIMEQLSGTPGCWNPMGPTLPPGMLEGYSMQAFAHGADKVIHFRWRSVTKGAEMFWHGLIDHSNRSSRRLKEFTALANRLEELKIPEDTKIKNEVAIIMSFEQESALKFQPQADGFGYYNMLKRYHDGITSLGCGCDIISEHSDFSDYKVIIAPALYLTFNDTAERLHSFAENGGRVVLTSRSGVKDEHNNCIMQPLPTVYSDMTGCIVDEYDAIGKTDIKISMNGKKYSASIWCDIMENQTADVIGVYEERFYKNTPCILSNKFGKGLCYYVGVIGDREFNHDLMRDILIETGISVIDNLPQNVEITRRKNAENEYIFVFNNNDYEVCVDTDEIKCKLAPFECNVFVRNCNKN